MLEIEAAAEHVGLDRAAVSRHIEHERGVLDETLLSLLERRAQDLEAGAEEAIRCAEREQDHDAVAEEANANGSEVQLRH